MVETEMRQVQGDELLEKLYQLSSYAFHPSPPLTDAARWKEWVVGRLDSTTCLMMFEDGVPASVTVSTDMLQNVRGKLYAESGIWAVSTAPAARRSGYCRRLMSAQFSAARDAGQAFSCLYPFRESFYEKLGYVTLPASRLARLATDTLLPLLKKDFGGQIRMRRAQDGIDERQAYLREKLEQVHGMAIFDRVDPHQSKQPDFWQVEVWIDGKMEGLMPYEIQPPSGDHGRMQFCALRFYYNTSQAKYLMLQWIARHVDQTEKVSILLSPSERPETWFSDMQVKTESYAVPMGRVIDVSKIGGMQVGAGSFTATISDPLCPWNEGAWRFEAVDGLLQVSLLNAASLVEPEVDCELSIQALTALAYGTHDVGDFVHRGWGNPPAQVQAVLQSMFPEKDAYVDEMF
jgi:predicted acetyltransferase